MLTKLSFIVAVIAGASWLFGWGFEITAVQLAIVLFLLGRVIGFII